MIGKTLTRVFGANGAWGLALAGLTILAMLAGPALQAHADNVLNKTEWPEYRSPERDGKTPEAGWKKEISGEPPVLWKKTIGIGYSTPVIVDGKCYTMGGKDDVDTVYCFDAETGKEIWASEYAAPTNGRGYYGPRGTPTVDGDRVYTFSLDGQIFCWDAATGDKKWSKKYSGPAPKWGFSCSPLIVGDNVIMDMGPIVALNKHTGETVWQTEAFKPGYSSPMLFNHDGRDYIAAFPGYGLVIVTPQGQVVAKTPWKTRFDMNAATPIYRDGKIFIGSGYRTGGALYSFSGTELKQLWMQKDMQTQCNTAVLQGDHLYGFSGDVGGRGKLTCVNWADGEIRWQERGLGTGSLIISDGKMIVLGEEGDLVLADVTPDALRITQKMGSIGGLCWTSPVLSGGRLYLRNYHRREMTSELIVYDLR